MVPAVHHLPTTVAGFPSCSVVQVGAWRRCGNCWAVRCNHQLWLVIASCQGHWLLGRGVPIGANGKRSRRSLTLGCLPCVFATSMWSCGVRASLSESRRDEDRNSMRVGIRLCRCPACATACLVRWRCRAKVCQSAAARGATASSCARGPKTEPRIVRLSLRGALAVANVDAPLETFTVEQPGYFALMRLCLSRSNWHRSDVPSIVVHRVCRTCV